jgi:hypothetical protein
MATGMLRLDDLQIASPCSASWDSMVGTDRVRYCTSCKLNVYNLSGMSREEAEELIGLRDGRSCVRFFRRADGTVMTTDCPVGAHGWFVRSMLIVASAAALVLLAFGLTPGTAPGERNASWLARTEPFRTILNWINPPRTAPRNPPCVMGKMKI